MSSSWKACALFLVLAACSKDESCPSPNVLRYEQQGCDAAPVCGSPEQDASATVVCGCDGQTLIKGGDYAKAAWRAYGMCSSDCVSPTHSTEAVGFPGNLPGCPCDPAKDTPVCRRPYRFTCVNGAWSIDACP
jgi:hypothetical protein